MHNAPLEYATFTDGEWLVLCTVPDDNGAGGSQANSEGAPYTVYQQGFRCDAAIGVGGSDSTPYLAKTSDSLEYSQTYTETSDGISQSVTALTTTCIGQLPNSVTIDTSAVPHLVSCTQYDPNAPGQVVRGLGETITYPDGQFQETCNVPAYRQDVVCVTGVSCSTDASADCDQRPRDHRGPGQSGHADRTSRSGQSAELRGTPVRRLHGLRSELVHVEFHRHRQQAADLRPAQPAARPQQRRSLLRCERPV